MSVYFRYLQSIIKNQLQFAFEINIFTIPQRKDKQRNCLLASETITTQVLQAQSQIQLCKIANFQFILLSLKVLLQIYSDYNQIKQIDGMQALKSENAKLTMIIEEYLEEIEKQKQINSQHENQIETLLLFNQRLLSIIENEINEKKKESCSLQPISERSERSSDLFGQCTIESLIKSKKLVAKSEWGRPTKSLIGMKFLKDIKGDLFDHVSDIDSIKIQKQSETAVNEEDIQAELKKSTSTTMGFRREVQKGLEELRAFKDKTNIFYDKKLVQIKSLSIRLNDYHPLKEITKISSKIAVSNETLNLINKRISKIV